MVGELSIFRDVLTGLEGAGAAAYFRAYATLIDRAALDIDDVLR